MMEKRVFDSTKLLEVLKEVSLVHAFEVNKSGEISGTNQIFEQKFINEPDSPTLFSDIFIGGGIEVFENLFESKHSNSQVRLEIPLKNPSPQLVVLDCEIIISKSGNYLVMGIEVPTHKYRIFQNIAKVTNNGVIISDREGLTTWVNEGFTKMTGYTLSDMKGKKPGAILQGKNTDQKAVKKLHDAVASGKSIQIEILNYRKDGSEIILDLMMEPYYSNAGEHLGFFAIQPEITRHKREKIEQFDKAYTKLNWIFKHMPSAALITNDEGTFLDLNNEAKKLFDITDHQLQTLTINQIGEVNTDFNKSWNKLKENSMDVGSMKLKLDPESKVKISVNYLAIQNLVDDVNIYIFRKKSNHSKEEKLQREKAVLADNLKANFQLFLTIAHDLKSPLNSLSSFLEAYSSGAFQQTEIDLILKQLSIHTKYSYDILNDLLLWGKTQISSKETDKHPFNIKRLINEVIEKQSSINKKHKIECINEIDHDIHCFANPSKIEVVFRNLLNNSIKFSPDGSCIRFYSEIGQKNLYVFVEDEGKGIPDNLLEQIFKIDYTTRGIRNEKGTGIGLSLCKSFMEHNGGTITALPDRKKGACFKVSLPLFLKQI